MSMPSARLFVALLGAVALGGCVSHQEAFRRQAAQPPVPLAPDVVSRLAVSLPDYSWSVVRGPSEDNPLAVLRLAQPAMHAYVEITGVRFTAGTPVEAAELMRQQVVARGLVPTEWQDASDGSRASFRFEAAVNSGQRVTVRFVARRIAGLPDGLFYVVGTWPSSDEDDLGLPPFFAVIVDSLVFR